MCFAFLLSLTSHPALAQGSQAAPPVSTGPSEVSVISWILVGILVFSLLVVWQQTRAWVRDRLEPVLAGLNDAADARRVAGQVSLRPYSPAIAMDGDHPPLGPVLSERWVAPGSSWMIGFLDSNPTLSVVADLLAAPDSIVTLASDDLTMSDLHAVLGDRSPDAPRRASGRVFMTNTPEDNASVASLLSEMASRAAPAVVVIQVRWDGTSANAHRIRNLLSSGATICEALSATLIVLAPVTESDFTALADLATIPGVGGVRVLDGDALTIPLPPAEDSLADQESTDDPPTSDTLSTVLPKPEPANS